MDCADVSAELTFVSDLPIYKKEKLYEVWYDDVPAGIPRTNIEFTSHNVMIQDVRQSRSRLGLDTTGFMFLDHKSASLPTAQDLLSSETTPRFSAYLDECIDFVKAFTSGEKVVCFNWRYRKNQPRTHCNVLWENMSAARDQTMHVAAVIHSDDSQVGGHLKLARHLTEAELIEFDEGKWDVRFLNLWRPLVANVEDAPLAFCDRRTVNKDDFLEVDKIHEDYLGENNYLQFNPHQQWYYLARQTPDEPALFVTWDSNEHEYPGAPPHTAFINALATPDMPERESIEVRMMVMSRRTMMT